MCVCVCVCVCTCGDAGCGGVRVSNLGLKCLTCLLMQLIIDNNRKGLNIVSLISISYSTIEEDIKQL